MMRGLYFVVVWGGIGNPAEFHAFNFGYDVVGHSLEVLRESEQGGV